MLRFVFQFIFVFGLGVAALLQPRHTPALVKLFAGTQSSQIVHPAP